MLWIKYKAVLAEIQSQIQNMAIRIPTRRTIPDDPTQYDVIYLHVDPSFVLLCTSMNTKDVLHR